MSCWDWETSCSPPFLLGTPVRSQMKYENLAAKGGGWGVMMKGV